MAVLLLLLLYSIPTTHRLVQIEYFSLLCPDVLPKHILHHLNALVESLQVHPARFL